MDHKKPCRVLFVRNIDYATTEKEVRELFDRFGEIKTVFDLIKNRGLVFVTFFDIRAAEAAKQALQGSEFKHRTIDIHYSTPKAEDMGKRCEKGKNQGTLHVELAGSQKSFDKEALRKYLDQFGELKDVRVVRGAMHQAFVEYYDSRHCEAAYDAIQNDGTFQGSKMSVRLMWDDPPSKKREEERKRSRSRSRSPPRRDRDSDRRDYPYSALLDNLARGLPPAPPAVAPVNPLLGLMQGGQNPAALAQILSLLQQPSAYAAFQQPQGFAPGVQQMSFPASPSVQGFPQQMAGFQPMAPMTQQVPPINQQPQYQQAYPQQFNQQVQGVQPPAQQQYRSYSSEPANTSYSSRPKEEKENPQLQQLAELLRKTSKQ
ncbi:hypothetical protein EDD86DRAFT_209057 [Gorgonomyces haynaldii]|nr:hypothetical protein EDD86DRAFT_209057 [Gorgonomyces haynaldii]